jgi:hypothetical protein
MPLKHLFRFICAISFSLTSIGAMAQSAPLTSENYMQDGANMGVVLLSVRWDRKWNCSGFQNAQFRLIGFDLFPSKRSVDDEGADLLLNDAPLLLTKPRFDDYAFLVEPGQYALSKLHIKVARSVRDVGIAKAGREVLLKEGSAFAGTFNVDAGEVVYIGHFYIDCAEEPSLWRYYLKDRESFNEYLADQKKKVPELDTSKASFRLFKSSYFGRDFELE